MHPSESTPSAPTERKARRRREHRRTHTVAFLLSCIALWLYVGILPMHIWQNPIIVPTWFLLGAATVPLTLFWVMIHRLRTTDTVTVLNLVLAAVIGGSLAVVLGGSLDSLVALVPQEHRVLSLTAAGFVEEFAKGVLIVALGWRVAKTARNGLFVGGAVGLGFAVLETTGYIFQAFTGAHPIAAASVVTLVRGISAPFGHVLWSALLGAAVFAAAAGFGRFRVTWTVVGAYVGVAVLHGIWDGSATLAADLTTDAIVRIAAGVFGVVVPVVVGGLVWRRVARRTAAPTPAEAAGPTSSDPAEAAVDAAAPRELVGQD